MSSEYIIDIDQPKYSNRFIHCANSDTYIMTGDKPLIRFACRRVILGTLRFFDENGFPLDEKNGYTAKHRSGESIYEIDGIQIRTGTPENERMCVVSIRTDRKLRIEFGGVHYAGDGDWSVFPQDEGNYETVAFDPSQLGETYTPVEGGYRITRPEVDGYLEQHFGRKTHFYIRADFPMRIEAGMAAGNVTGDATVVLFLLEEGHPLPSAEGLYADVERYAEDLSKRFQVHTPNEALNAQCAYAANYQNGIWYPPRHMHNNVSWNAPFLGWTNRYGTDVLGWHDRSLAELKYYSTRQNTENRLQGAPQRDDEHRGCMPAEDSRFYGRGHITEDQAFYNMQTQFFDQAIHAWRMDGSAERARVLRPMLDLHCEWMDECFDPDGDGAYESVIDTWPTDSVWCDGGAAPEATCYACRAHEAAAELARLDGDEEAASRHEDIVRRIRRGFFGFLWNPSLGVAGRCREQGGLGRLLDNPWSYSVFLPIDVDLLNPIEAAQSLYYAQWAYQHDPTENGSVIWHSNLIPSIWSVRWKGGNEQWMLAQAYWKAGLIEAGMELMNGALESEGLLGSDGTRAILEGLFGYRPDYPRKKVLLAPMMPFDWPCASMRTPDMTLDYSRDTKGISLEYELPQSADVEIRIPVYAGRILRVRGAEPVRLEPGFGRTIAVLNAGFTSGGSLRIETEQETPPVPLREVKAPYRGRLSLRCSQKPLEAIDPQRITRGCRLTNETAEIELNIAEGRHWFAIRTGESMPMYECFGIAIEASPERKDLESRLHAALPEKPRFEYASLDSYFNCAVEDIYKQKYLSPRPETVSVRIGTDGYSPWTFSFWHNSPPEIQLSRKGTVYSGEGIPFIIAEGKPNIAFVSRWDNFPTEIRIPVHGTWRMAALVLCGTSNPMHCGIENVRLTFEYADDTSESIPIRNPQEFWSLCPLAAQPSAAGQASYNDYDNEIDGFCLPKQPPETLQLGENCRAVVLRFRLKSDTPLRAIQLTAMSKEIVIGIMAVTMIE